MSGPKGERADGSEESFDLSRGIRLGIGAAGITGLLALFGFLVNVARADLLGVDLGVGGVANLAQSAGNFLLDSLLLALQSWSALASFSILVLLFLGLRYYSPSHRGPHFLTSKVAAWAEAILVLAALASVLVEYELPAVRVRDVLIGNDICNHVTNRPDLISERADFLWALYAHSKGYKNGCANLDVFSALHKTVVKPKDDSRAALNNIYGIAVANRNVAMNNILFMIFFFAEFTHFVRHYISLKGFHQHAPRRAVTPNE
jgi:hypothetical protein